LIILFANSETFVGRLLAFRGFVAVGLISYSAYLWHQPLFVFARIRSIGEPSAQLYLALAFGSLMLAWLSWKYVEQPFRNKQAMSRMAIIGFSATAGVILVGLSTAVKVKDGFPGRFDANFGDVFARLRPAALRKCGGTIPEEGNCTIGSETTPTIAILGDSQAMVLANFMDPELDKLDTSAVQLAKNGCVPIRNLLRTGYNGTCKQYNDDVFDYLSNNEQIESIVLLARWTLFMERSRFNNREGGVERGKEVIYIPKYTDFDKLTVDRRKTKIGEYYKDGIEQLLSLGKRIIVVYPVPEVGWDPERVAFLSTQFMDLSFKDITISTSYAVFKERNKAAYTALDSIPPHPMLFRVKPEEIFCDTFLKGRCVAAINGKQFYRDDDHLGEVGASLVNAKIIEIIKQAF